MAATAVRWWRGPDAGIALAWLVVAAVALAVTGGSLGRGWLLYRDFVAVPEPVLGPQSLGVDGSAPRAVPLDAVTALLHPLVPAWLQQQVMLVACVLAAGWGVAWLLRRRGAAAMVAGGVCAVWNPFVAERLLVGQPPTLLAYAMTPWVVAAVRSPRPAPQRLALVVLAALPAALTPWGGVCAAAVALAASLLTPGRRTRGWLAAVTVAGVAWCLPWVVPALAGPGVVADPDGADAFAVRADGPLGTVGSVLTLGGIWAQGAWPGSRASAGTAVAAVGLVAAAAAGAALLVRAGRRRRAVLLGVAYAVPVTVALLLATGPGLAVFRVLQAVPGVALARDTHRLVGFSALAVALLVGHAVGRTGRRAGSVRRGALAVGAAALAVLSVPDLPGEARSAYRPVAYPASWASVVRAAEEAPGEGEVLLMPWQPFRLTAWAGDEPFLDPLPRALRRPSVSSFDLLVRRDGREVAVDGGDPEAGVAWSRGELDPAQLRRLGIDVVVVWKGTPGALPEASAGFRRLLDTPEFSVWAVSPV